MKSTLLDVAAAIRLSRAALRNIHENLFWAFIYNVIGIPLAAGVFVGLGLTLNPMYGAAAMSLSSFCVVSNALRLNLCKLYSAKHDHKGKPMLEIHLAEQNKEETGMTKTLHVKGMMCGHCEARVKKNTRGCGRRSFRSRGSQQRHRRRHAHEGCFERDAQGCRRSAGLRSHRRGINEKPQHFETHSKVRTRIRNQQLLSSIFFCFSKRKDWERKRVRGDFDFPPAPLNRPEKPLWFFWTFPAKLDAAQNF